MADSELSYYVVGIGASAGGLQAVIQLLSQLPEDISIACIFVQHLDRRHPSELAEILARSGKLPVTWIADHTPLQPAHVYVLPPDREVIIQKRVLILGQRRTESAVSTIDHFLQSLAEDCKERAVAVILSGTGSDGAVGLRAIKAAGGKAFVQEESSAAFSGMGRAAIKSSDVDGILPPERIAEELIKLSSGRSARALVPLSLEPSTESLTQDTENWTLIFRLLTTRKGVDFSNYKQSTIMRRLLRRMALRRSGRVSDYLALLLKDRGEVDALYESLLINVTTFFRDPEYFEFLQTHIFPGIVADHAPHRAPIRIWVPGCSTGEEAYSLAILFCEVLESSARTIPVQIFATDLSESAIERARSGTYAPADLTQVSPDRVGRFFSSTPCGLVVKKHLRDMCIFARQNVTKDSPFSHLDLISCRNLLIYLGANLQRKLMPIFHYALDPGGHLVLGTSESVGAHVDLFRLVDRRFRIYTRKSSANRRMTFDFTVKDSSPEFPTQRKPAMIMPDDANDPQNIMREADRVVLGRHGPPGVLVSEELEILQFRGNISPYLAPMTGRASLSLLKMAVEGLASELEAAVAEAKKKKVRILRTGIPFTHADEARQIDLDVTPLDDGRDGERFYLILFMAHDALAPDKPQKNKRKPGRNDKTTQLLAQIEQLKQDLQAARNYLQSTIEKHEATNQELRAANEEIQSSNEELQSTNEELETAKEELQSTNEELTTVNEELHSRQGELIQVNNDLHNLINSVHLPIIILGQDMRIRRFTPMAEHVLNVIPTDIGRPLSDLNINLNVTDLPRLMSEVVESLTIREMEVQDHQGHWYSMRLRPYKTAENRIEGVVMTLIDIDQIKRAMGELEDARLFANGIGEIVAEPLVAVNDRLEIRVATQAFHRLFGTSRDQIYGRLLLDTVPILREAPRLVETLAAAVASGENIVDFAIVVKFPSTGKRELLVSVRHSVALAQSQRTMLISFRPVEGVSP